MVWWLFKKRHRENSKGDLNSHLHKSLKQSFSNVKNDIGKIHSHISSINSKNKQHEEKIGYMLSRLEAIENHLGFSSIIPLEPKEHLTEQENLGSISSINKEPFFPGIWESLTETERKICWKLSLLQKESPDQWIPLKYLARELYPDKDYSKIRSTVSQFIANLEELGFVKRKRLGRQAYIFLIREKKSKKKELAMPALSEQA
ncbi:hypothetical protein HZB88_00960 [archaeon]|nr:hypothetical protein [archaeon]